uniref:Capsid protein n=1 Tax=Planotaenium ohtanii toti-like virus TaxID=2933122 RepID=A0A9C7LLM5_9VIRU|nr:putative capsid protein [Planotaenium ohtanii toti-like virus]CAI5383897.1 putative capsid protein [Planotaenium ohtanii toti-like virus]
MQEKMASIPSINELNNPFTKTTTANQPLTASQLEQLGFKVPAIHTALAPLPPVTKSGALALERNRDGYSDRGISMRLEPWFDSDWRFGADGQATLRYDILHVSHRDPKRTRVGRVWKPSKGKVQIVESKAWGDETFTLQPAAAATAGELVDRNVLTACENINAMFPTNNMADRAALGTADTSNIRRLINDPSNPVRMLWRMAIMWWQKAYAEHIGTRVVIEHPLDTTRVRFVNSAKTWVGQIAGGGECNWAPLTIVNWVHAVDTVASVLAVAISTQMQVTYAGNKDMPDIFRSWPSIDNLKAMVICGADSANMTLYGSLSAADVWDVAAAWAAQNSKVDLLVEIIEAIGVWVYSPVGGIAPFHMNSVTIGLPAARMRSNFMAPIATKRYEWGEQSGLVHQPPIEKLLLEGLLLNAAWSAATRHVAHLHGLSHPQFLSGGVYRTARSLFALGSGTSSIMMQSEALLNSLGLEGQIGRILNKVGMNENTLSNVEKWCANSDGVQWEEIMPSMPQMPETSALVGLLHPVKLKREQTVYTYKWYTARDLDGVTSPAAAYVALAQLGAASFGMQYYVPAYGHYTWAHSNVAKNYRGVSSDWAFMQPMSFQSVVVETSYYFKDSDGIARAMVGDQLMAQYTHHIVKPQNAPDLMLMDIPAGTIPPDMDDMIPRGSDEGRDESGRVPRGPPGVSKPENLYRPPSPARVEEAASSGLPTAQEQGTSQQGQEQAIKQQAMSPIPSRPDSPVKQTVAPATASEEGVLMVGVLEVPSGSSSDNEESRAGQEPDNGTVKMDQPTIQQQMDKVKGKRPMEPWMEAAQEAEAKAMATVQPQELLVLEAPIKSVTIATERTDRYKPTDVPITTSLKDLFPKAMPLGSKTNEKGTVKYEQILNGIDNEYAALVTRYAPANLSKWEAEKKALEEQRKSTSGIEPKIITSQGPAAELARVVALDIARDAGYAGPLAQELIKHNFSADEFRTEVLMPYHFNPMYTKPNQTMLTHNGYLKAVEVEGEKMLKIKVLCNADKTGNPTAAIANALRKNAVTDPENRDGTQCSHSVEVLLPMAKTDTRANLEMAKAFKNNLVVRKYKIDKFDPITSNDDDAINSYIHALPLNLSNSMRLIKMQQVEHAKEGAPYDASEAWATAVREFRKPKAKGSNGEWRVKSPLAKLNLKAAKYEEENILDALAKAKTARAAAEVDMGQQGVLHNMIKVNADLVDDYAVIAAEVGDIGNNPIMGFLDSVCEVMTKKAATEPNQAIVPPDQVSNWAGYIVRINWTEHIKPVKPEWRVPLLHIVQEALRYALETTHIPSHRIDYIKELQRMKQRTAALTRNPAVDYEEVQQTLKCYERPHLRPRVLKEANTVDVPPITMSVDKLEEMKDLLTVDAVSAILSTGQPLALTLAGLYASARSKQDAEERREVYSKRLALREKIVSKADEELFYKLKTFNMMREDIMTGEADLGMILEMCDLKFTDLDKADQHMVNNILAKQGKYVDALGMIHDKESGDGTQPKNGGEGSAQQEETNAAYTSMRPDDIPENIPHSDAVTLRDQATDRQLVSSTGQDAQTSTSQVDEASSGNKNEGTDFGKNGRGSGQSELGVAEAMHQELHMTGGITQTGVRAAEPLIFEGSQ